MWSKHAVLLATLMPTAASTPQVGKPSFLFILGDDIGWADFSYNNGTAVTPRIDAWTERAGTIVAQNFHSAGTVCSPTRASVLTGRNPYRDCVNGVYGCSDMTECVPNFPFAPRETFTIAHAARAADQSYVSQFWGKWHLGSFYNDSYLYGGFVSSPTSHGFDHFNATVEVAPTATTNCMCREEWSDQCNFGHNKKATHCSGHGNPGGSDLPAGCCFNYWWEDTTQPHGITNLTNPVGEDDSAYIADSFERFVRGLGGKPFLAQLSFHNCHKPYIGMDTVRDACEGGKDCAADDKHGHLATDFSDAQLDFYACLRELDTSVGRVLDVLDEKDYYSNTMIFFSTDNGPEGNCGPEGFCDDSHFTKLPGDAGPLRGRKRDIFEGGHRVPGIISWPAVVGDQHHESWHLMLSSDFLPTVMDALGVERPAAQATWGMDGVSLLPLLRGEEMPQRGMGWLFGSWPPKNRGFVYGKWKYVHGSRSCTHDDCNAELLFDLDTDLGETTDLSKKHPDVLNAIRANFTSWYKSVEQSRNNESQCDNLPPAPPAPTPGPAPPSLECKWHDNTGLQGGDIAKIQATSKEHCCGLCRTTTGCAAADHRPSDGTAGLCHLKKQFSPVARDDGSIACVPNDNVIV